MRLIDKLANKFGSKLKIATILRSPITIHWTFPLYGLFVLTQVGLTMGVPLLCSMFVSVLLHELGHVWAAQKRNIPTGEISLNLFGGMASIKLDASISATDELVVGLAGPAVSFGLAVLALGGAFLIPVEWVRVGLTWLFATNAVLFAFNMLPAFPLDGGRVLRSLLRYKLGWARATKIAVWVAYIVFAGVAVASVIFQQWILLAMLGLLILGATLERLSVEEE